MRSELIILTLFEHDEIFGVSSWSLPVFELHLFGVGTMNLRSELVIITLFELRLWFGDNLLELKSWP